ncbi:MAG TPA: hypothetical protein VF163_14905 [Micromonosporaceae bacterium]
MELTDPARSDEWIVVRFGRDELPFSPADLALPVRAAPARRADRKHPVTAPAANPAASEPGSPSERASRTGKVDRAVARRAPLAPAGEASSNGHGARPPEPAPDAVRAAKAASGRPATPSNTPSPDAPSRSNTPPPSSSPAGPESSANQATHPAQPAAGRPARAAVRPRPPASLTVTLAYTDREWTVAATQGAKVLAKPYVVRPTDALRMVSMIDVPGVHDAVESIIAAERAEAESRAQRLRAELAEIESRLAELTRRE